MERIGLLDCGRFVAAIAVMAYHYFFNGIANGKIATLSHSPAIVDFAKYGYLGVEFFFIISGYVIFFSAQNRSASEFAVSRATRLYPAFWAGVLLTSLVASFWGGALMGLHGWEQIAANLTMIPETLGVAPVDGVYWTLLFELQFYLLVLLCLLAWPRKQLDLIFLAWPFAILGATLIGHGDLPYLGGYFAYFAAGALFAILKKRPSWPTVVALTVCFVLCLNFSTEQAAEMSATKGSTWSPYVVEAVIGAFYCFFALLNLPRLAQLDIPASRLLGGLTYPIYLIHAHIGYMLLTRFGTDENRPVAYLGTIATIAALAYLIHTLVERRFAKQWKALFKAAVGLPIQRLSSLGALALTRVRAD
jgi:peptidoglycan/LPS O-acetylase OafA/YrhL